MAAPKIDADGQGAHEPSVDGRILDGYRGAEKAAERDQQKDGERRRIRLRTLEKLEQAEKAEGDGAKEDRFEQDEMRLDEQGVVEDHEQCAFVI